jgi:hypothetical protein
MELSDILKRLKSQHSDLLQGAYFTTKEDPEWDATLDAVTNIEDLREHNFALIGDVADREEKLFARTAEFEKIKSFLEALRDDAKPGSCYTHDELGCFFERIEEALN